MVASTFFHARFFLLHSAIFFKIFFASFTFPFAINQRGDSGTSLILKKSIPYLLLVFGSLGQGKVSWYKFYIKYDT